ncbi:uncharacterized protein BDZ99DRAFT_459756 [Mytilinidion resinicola]|uniref:Uncharacterized protein n=1 Tax=Mytilinidion resinicola TaxID=574789 RepID=A0A6A6Z161_9PEZI|nr:uncharacterized protein BDZ99DRAFT_459756 [Mytilinidion resinicola]KAF2814014.1 hypothetical protein BDZ99DRAFT_459756 [Mytilinidion resinicola]
MLDQRRSSFLPAGFKNHRVARAIPPQINGTASGCKKHRVLLYFYPPLQSTTLEE